ncbi:alkaline phosphatase family protein [Amycolatopsis methanolica]|uniref:alkaline phosphatase family protein n=1 Tax=Amycolatopsis methanolica TaxID=1814 RepID=UPI00342C0680
MKAGRLPAVSWIVAPEAFTEHPNRPANYGAWYIARVLDALTANPEVWSRTALFITYDENDGFFDHVVPPYPDRSAVDLTGELLDGQPYGLGQRVPMLAVSPWSKGGRVCSQVFDHTSIVRFLERRFGVHEPNISPWRRAICGDLTAAFDFSRTDAAVPGLPGTDGYYPPDRERHPDYVPAPPADPALPRQERGQRPALPLPYDLTVDGQVRDGALRLTFASRGPVGAHFHVTSAAGPRGYTVGAGQRLSDEWPTSSEVVVHGPNGFYRRFAGSGAEVTARPVGEDLQLVLTNPGHTRWGWR